VNRSVFHSLRFKLISTAIFVEVVMLSLLVWNGVRLMEEYLSNQMEYRVTELKPLLNASLSGPVLQEDIVTIREIMDQYRSDETQYYAIYNSANEVLATSGQAIIANKVSRSDNPSGYFNAINQNIYFMHMPIMVFGRAVGYLDLELDTSFIEQAMTTVRQQSLGIALSEIFLSALLLSVIGLALTRHLKSLTSAAHSMAEGDLSVRINVETQDEIGEAAVTFNRMADNISENELSLRQSALQIRELNEELEQRVEKRTEELQQTNVQLSLSLEQLGQTQDQLVQAEKMASLGALVAGVAHEANTPIGLGVTTASYLENKVSEIQRIYESGEMTRNDFEKFQRSAIQSSQIISSNLKRAADLIQSFKQVAVDQSAEERRCFDVCGYTHEVLRSFKPKFINTSYDLQVSCKDGLTFNSYPGGFAQILTNLIMNSFNHGFEGIHEGKIEINIEKQQDYIRIQYKDNGKGMDEKTKKKIFDPFYTTSRGSGGSGLGMHIVYNLITQTFFGDIDCESSPGGGVVFEIKLRESEESLVDGEMAV